MTICEICGYSYSKRICECKRNSYRGWSVWSRIGVLHAQQHGVRISARNIQELARAIDNHIHDRDQWYVTRREQLAQLAR